LNTNANMPIHDPSSPDFMSEMMKKQSIPLPKPSTSFEGKTVIVTGSNTGLGREAARHFVDCKASRVIMAVRTLSKGEEAKADIEASSGTKGVAEVWQLDLTSYASVKAFAKQVQQLERLDVVIENASVAVDTYSQAEGTELTMTVNVYSTFLLAVLLLPKLSETAKKYKTQPVLNIVGSGAGFFVPFLERKSENIFETIESKKDVEDIAKGRYSLSKIVQFFATRELSALLPVSQTDVIINYLSPGLVNTELNRNLSEENNAPIVALREKMARTSEDGARTLFYSAIAGPESHGHYISECAIAE
jgi:retinol dehydrogenase 12